MGRPWRLTAPAVVLGASLALAAPLQPFGHACAVRNGVRFCPTTELADRVPSFDGVPLDVDVTLPPSGDGPFPTIAMLHGLGGTKLDFESSSPDDHYSNVFYALRGYAVVNYSARGWGRSCGTPASRTAACARGWIHLADQRWEARDAQYLLGLLVDEGVARRDGLGVTGVSYGGGQSIQLAFLRGAVRGTDGRLRKWRSPRGTRLRVGAAFARWGWSDLADSLVPNGRLIDFRPATARLGDRPVGVEKEGYVQDLLLLAELTGYLAPPGVDPTADLRAWAALIGRGEPYGRDVGAITTELRRFHSAVGLLGRSPAPLLLENGFTDDLFPAPEALRVYEVLRQRSSGARIALLLGDLGHSRGQNAANLDADFNDQAAVFFDAHLKGQGGALPPGTVRVFAQTCPPGEPANGPYQAASWGRIHPRRFRFGEPIPQTVTSDGGSRSTEQAIAPVSGGGACVRVPAAPAPGTARYEAVSPGLLVVGLPTVKARVRTTGPFGQLAGRLWDVGPDGQQTLIARGSYRLTPAQRGRVLFQLHGNAYAVPAGHGLVLELVGRDAPYLRPSNGTFTVDVLNAWIFVPAAS
jgi:hypothetical protein